MPYLASLASAFNCDVLGVLAPDNDTRDNLIMLAADRQKQDLPQWPVRKADENEEGYYWGEGSVCVSDASGAAAFAAAVDADAGIPAAEKATLKALRNAVKCSDGSAQADAAAQLASVQSANGKAFAAYLTAVTDFYLKSHTDAAGFAALSNATNPWVKEAAHYMQARITLLQSQALAFDDYGSLDRSKIDQGQVVKAREALTAYLTDYPAGAYAASAKGLLRRADWVSGDPATLAATYSKIVTGGPVTLATMDIANEIDLKLPLESYTNAAADPLLLAVQDLRLMRSELDENDNAIVKFKAEDLEAQRPRFAGQEALFTYLLAARAWYADKNGAEVLRLLGVAAPSGKQSYLDLSTQMLRAAALDASGDASARDLYLQLLPLATQAYQRPTVEMALAKFDERHKNISAVFDENSQITDPDIRMKLLDYVAGPIILKMQATSDKASQAERETAIYRLFVRDMTQGRFKGFLEDIKLLPPKPAPNADGDVEDKFAAFRWEGGSDDGYACPDVVQIAKALAANPKDVKGRLCLGDFFRTQDVVPIEPAEKDALGGTGSIFGGAELARHDFYTSIMHDKQASRSDRAYALFRAIHCYQPVGNNACGGGDGVELSQRKAWFNELRAKYGDTSWGRSARVYW
ncbi:MAG: hypothetical protein U1E15_13185 [Hyphomicrobiales bacterium]